MIGIGITMSSTQTGKRNLASKIYTADLVINSFNAAMRPLCSFSDPVNHEESHIGKY
jgi:hypothetical protein